MESADGKPKSAHWMRNFMKYAVPLLVTVCLCALMFRNFDFDSMMQIISSQCDFRWILLTLAISILSHIARAFRWGIQLHALGIKAPAGALILSIFGTYAINLVFPRLGEFWRTGYIAQRQNAPFATVFGSMVADRVADTITVLLLLLLSMALASSHIVSYLGQNADTFHRAIALVTSPWLWLFVIGCIAAAWWLLTRKSESGSLLSKAKKFMAGLWQGFAVVATMPHKGLWLLLTIAVWGCYFMQLYFAFFSFPFTSAVVQNYGLTAVLVTFVLSSIAMGVPSNGGIGPWQWAVIFALSFYGVQQTDSNAFANLVLGTETMLLIVLGIFTFVTIMVQKRKITKN